MIKILIIEDTEETRELLKIILSDLVLSKKLKFFESSSIKNSKDILSNEKIDIILLDLNLPDGNGSEIINYINETSVTSTPFIVAITADNSQQSINKNLELGCEYYIQKPFDYDEIKIRIRKLIKRLPSSSDIFKYNNISIFKDKNIVTYKNEKIILSKNEFNLLFMFMVNRGILLTREQILNEVWYDNFEVSDKAVDQCIKRLRKKIPILNEILISKRGFGYIFE